MTRHTCGECLHFNPCDNECVSGKRKIACDTDACCYAFETSPPKRGDVMELRNTPEWWWVDLRGEVVLKTPGGRLLDPAGGLFLRDGCVSVTLLGPCVVPEKMEVEE